MPIEELSREQVEVLRAYREGGCICEFLESVIGSEDDPFVLLDHERAALRAIWDYRFTYLIWARRLGKTFTISHAIIGLASLLSGMPHTMTIGVLSGTGRQVKIIFQEIRRSYFRSPFLQSISIKEPKFYPDRCEWRLKGYAGYEGITVVGYPLNSQRGSSTLRGFGFPIIFLDEFQLIPRESYKSIFPTGAVAGNPVLRIISGDKRRDDDPAKLRMVLSGTAYWEFVPAYETYSLFRRYMDLNQKVNLFLRSIGEGVGEDTATAAGEKTGEGDTGSVAGGGEEEVLDLIQI